MKFDDIFLPFGYNTRVWWTNRQTTSRGKKAIVAVCHKSYILQGILSRGIFSVTHPPERTYAGCSRVFGRWAYVPPIFRAFCDHRL